MSSRDAPVQVVDGTRQGNRIAIVLKGYPRLSETFIAQEIFGLEQLGFNIEIVSLRHPTDDFSHEIHDRIEAPVRYLPEYLHAEPMRVTKAVFRQIVKARFWPVALLWLKDLRRDLTSNRVRRFGQACVLACELDEDFDWIYAHFLHTPGSVARYAALLTNRPFSLSAHAKDIWTIEDWEIKEKLADSQWVVCCTKGNTDHLRKICPDAQIHLVYHGLDTNDVAPSDHQHLRDGCSEAMEVHILCVARAVEKKGIDVLLNALAALPSNLHWKLTHIGGGTNMEALKAQASQLKLGDTIRWLGPKPRNIVLEEMRKADIFCLPARIAEDGDRDGLPNVLLEAMTQELAVVTTDVGGITELVEDGGNGLIVERDEPSDLARALAQLINDPAIRSRFGKTGRKLVADHFDSNSGIAKIAALFTPAGPS